MLVRTIACVEGSVEVELVCEPAFDYGRAPGEWSLSSDRHQAEASGGGQTIRLQTDMLIGIEANHARARHVTPYGPAECAWRLADGRLVIAVTVPPNTTAEVVLPGRAPAEIGSGAHHFECDYQEKEQ